MRICYIYDAVWPWETGGVQRRVWELARRLTPDHEVHWFGLHYWDGPPVIEREGVVLHGVGSPPDLYVGDRRSITEAITFSIRLLPELLAEPFDVIDCQEFPYFPVFSSKLASARHNATLLVTWHEVWHDYWYEYLGRKGWFGKQIERVSTRIPDGHIAVSNRTRQDLSKLGATNVTTIPNGISLNEIAEVKPVDHDVDVLFVGRLIPEKNVDVLLGAINHLRTDNPDIQCVIIGDGPQRQRLESIVHHNNLANNVVFLGAVDDHKEVWAFMKQAKLFVLPSQREGFGITALEALGCGTPVVTTNHPQNAAQELIDPNVTGIVCECTPDRIANGITAALGLSRAECTAFAQTYDWDRIADQVQLVYQNSI